MIEADLVANAHIVERPGLSAAQRCTQGAKLRVCSATGLCNSIR